MLQIAAETGLKPSEFWDITEREFVAHIKGYRKAQNERWRMARLQAYMTYKMNVGKEGVSMEEFMPLDGDVIKKPKYSKVKSRKLIKQLNDNWTWPQQKN